MEVADPRACAEWNVTFHPAGRINGVVVDDGGRPLGRVWVELIPADATPHPDYGLNPRTATSGADGTFVFDGLGPGRYVVGVNLNDLPSEYRPRGRTIYPGLQLEPQEIELALGQEVDLGVFPLPPPIPVVPVRGVVVRQDGTPVGDVYVGASDETDNPVSRARGAGGGRTDAAGRFVIELRVRRIYTFFVRGARNELLRITSPRLDTTTLPAAPIRIVLPE